MKPDKSTPSTNVVTMLSLDECERKARKEALETALLLSQGKRTVAMKLLKVSSNRFFRLLSEFPDIADELPSKKPAKNRKKREVNFKP